MKNSTYLNYTVTKPRISYCVSINDLDQSWNKYLCFLIRIFAVLIKKASEGLSRKYTSSALMGLICVFDGHLCRIIGLVTARLMFCH